MELLGALGFSLILATLTQIPSTQAQDCTIRSISSPSASSLNVKWNKYIGATNYFLDLRVINATDIAPVVVTLPASSTEKVVQGLRPGTAYSVTVKVFQFYYVMCLDTQTASTVPATSQITYSKAISSRAIRLAWSQVQAADRYLVVVQSTATGERINITFTTLTGVISNLQPSTAYDCSVFSSNVAGLGASSRVRTITTLVQPPTGITATQTGKTTARVTWNEVDKVLLYEVTVTDLNNQRSAPFMTNVTTTYLDLNIQPCSTYRIGISSVNAFLEPGDQANYTYTTNTLGTVTSVSVDYSCSRASVTVTWGVVFGADSYRAVAIDSSGRVLSCTSTSTNCQITGLRCGKMYEVHVTAVSNTCESTANATSYFNTVPCPPQNLELFRECASNVIIFSWDPTNHTDFYVATAVDSHGERSECMTTETSCFFTDTVCGRGYDFRVYSVNGKCNSDVSPSTSVRTAPCAPDNVKTTAECQSDVLISTWNVAAGALSYTVEAWGNTGERNRYNCSSFTNSCAMPGVHCGESLTVYITSADDECSSERALGEVAETVPCVPQNVSAVMDCGSSSITLNWAFSLGAIFYIASAVHANGSVHTCQAVDTQCQIRGLNCGETYSAFVVASNVKCNSTESEHVTVETAPCPPYNIKAFLDCAANHALVVWQSHVSMASYTATMEDEEGGLLSCSTTSNNCKISELKCGQQYTVSVTHHNGICPSMPSSTIYMASVPCGPRNVWTNVDCGTRVLNVGWDVSVQAEAYTTTVSTGDGRNIYCNSTQTHCAINNLECGQSYMVVVMSVNGSCLSLPSKDQIIPEVPCVPTNVTAERTCGKNSVAVTWQASRGARYYTAVAVGNSGHRSNCSSNGTACSIADLQCGQVYTVGVMAVNNNCTSLKSQTVTLHTVPCPPSRVNGTIDCMSNAATLSWDPSPNAVSYSGSAVGGDGHTVSCNSSTPGCRLAGLHCGQQYTFTVTATDGSCLSPNSTEFRRETAPCAPQAVNTLLLCGTNNLTVSWNQSAIPLNYSATVRAADGTSLSCTSMGSSCNINSLRCGLQYNVTVTASNRYCLGPASVTRAIQTVPCVPLGVRGRVECGSNTLVASWNRSSGASAYITTVSGLGGQYDSCSTVNLSCSFRSLQCAQQYSISVVALGSQCNSTASAAVSLVTGPCDPVNVATNLQCGSNVTMVSWNASAGAIRYTVLAEGEAGSLSSCSTVSTSCQLSLLKCGNLYNVTVLADSGICNSTSRTPAVIQTAPCPPVITEHTLDCNTNTASVSWGRDPAAVGFVMNATSVLGRKVSCSTTNTSCYLTGLGCGQTYTMYGITLGHHCDSGPSTGVSIITAPCTPAAVSHQYDCNTNIALISWDDSLGREAFFTHVEAAGHVESCRTAETTCAFTNLRCGQLYNVSVKALASHCNSSQAVSTRLRTAPCAPSNVSASLKCANNTAVVSWTASEGMVAYNVTALGRDGDMKYCQTQNTSCQLPMMHCGQMYDITVTPYSETCGGFHSTAITFAAGPCPPVNVAVALQCRGNIGFVSWDAVIGAEMYLATAQAENGNTHTCNSSSTSCTLTNLLCGTTYSVTVATFKRGCLSEPSPRQMLKTAICPPMNLEGHTSCDTNILTLMWDPSPVVGVTYYLYSQKQGGANATYTTTDTSYFITGPRCGEHYTFMVSAQDAICNSSLSPPMNLDTAPCLPTNLGARVDCGTNLGTISWTPGVGGVTHIMEAVGVHGRSASCSSNGTSCSVKLDCGHRYTATVISSTGLCNSTLDATIGFDSAPCLPENVTAQLNCSRNVFAVQWQRSPGSETYTALAIGSDGYRTSCNTSSTACTIQNLHCGQTYSIAVTTSSVNCSNIQGSDYHVHSAPCLPQNPMVNLNCSSNVATVSWDYRMMEQINRVTAVDQQGHQTTCNTTGNNCTFSQLRCGESYGFTVVGTTDQCRTAVSSTMNLLTAPCVPTHVMANYDCTTGIAVIMWDSAQGADSYTVQADGSRGHSTSCSNTDTQCAISDMRCGQDYTIVVIARHSDCSSTASERVTVSTGPCPHTNLQASLDCRSNSAVISWTPGNGTLLYNASAESFAIGHRLSCTTNASACNISSLNCGQRYTVSVVGMGRTCNSLTGSWIAFNTAPCPPTNLRVASSCGSNMVAVSWNAAVGAVTYIAAAESASGHRAACNTSSMSCNITELQCGQTYQVSVTAMDENCVGGKSEIHILKTAPCVPQAVHTDLQCESGLLQITWQQSSGARRYYTSVQSSSGQVISCDTQNTTCVVPHLECGHTYSITVIAQDNTCNSSQSLATQVRAAPCPPVSVTTNVDCATSITTVFWDASVMGVQYSATAVDASGFSFTCNTTDSNCALTSLQCGTEYNVTVTGSWNSCSGAGSSQRTIRTAPCVPRLTEVEMDCLSDSAWVVWEESQGAELYVVTAEDSQGRVSQCNSSDNTCAVPGLQCGQHYAFTLTASDSQCTSVPSSALMSESAPCPPQDVYVNVGCENMTASISWAHSYGALTYTATLERTDGETTCCTTNNTSCHIADLPCGEMYVLTVTAEGHTCNSSQSAGIITRTVPCVPLNLDASLSCSNNVASVSWNNSKGGQFYSVEAISSDGHSATCSAHDSTCDLTTLHCGQNYTIAVVAQDSTCTSAKSQSVDVRTVPCIPENVVTDIDCGANSIAISWAESAGADSYIATLQDGDGHSTDCQTLGVTSCNVTGLNCGKIYHVTVAASDGWCTSPESPVTDAHSVPCSASNIQAALDCESQTTLVSWYFSAGATSYTVTAETASGDSVTCDTNTTNCEMTGLPCGEEYSISVQAQGEVCSSSAQMAGQLLTEPCEPLNVEVQYTVSIGQLLWDLSHGATYYTAEGITSEGLRVSCNTTDTTCVLYNMECGQVYNITVTAHNQVCRNTVTSEPISLGTEPCPPRNVEARVNCQTGTGSVSWEESIVAVGYEAFLDGRNGHSTSCYTTETSCSTHRLDCGTVYYVRVRAIGEMFNSTDITGDILVTVPCVPDSVNAEVDCENDTALVSWGWSDGAESYTLSAVGVDGHMVSCATEQNFCNVGNLTCGQTYNVSLTTINGQCQILSPTGVTFQTRPCPPLRLAVDLQCGTHTASLSWIEVEGVELYIARARTTWGGPDNSCNSTGSTCQFSNLVCGETYTFTVTAYSSQCQSEVSDTVEITTEPCQPGPMIAQGSCANDTVMLVWGDARGVSVYIVTVEGDLGLIMAFSTTNTTLEAQLPCGQSYSISVIAQGDRCDSPSSRPAQIRTAPCTPQQLESYINCEDSLGSVSWAQSDGAESYTAVAVGRDGNTTMCTTNGTSCTWTDLLCGDIYTVHVIADDYLCSSSPSNSTTIHTAPCVPQNLTSSLNCDLKVGSFTWDASKAAESYIVDAEASNGHSVALSTNSTSADISEFACGQVYYITVRAVGPVCRSGPSTPAALQTEPCAPTAVTYEVDCGTNTIVVAWAPADGAEYYTASVQSGSDPPGICMSSGTPCGITSMVCGQNYTVSVTASNQQCHSNPSQPINMHSAPCVPRNVTVVMNCTDNTALVSWIPSPGARLYNVTAQSSRGSPSSCKSSTPHCILTNLTCGSSYTVQVVAVDDTCSSLPSRPAHVQSVPCVPEITGVYLDCYLDSLLLEWAYAEGATSYTATAETSTGSSAVCTTNYTNCELLDLECGQVYTVSMVASDAICSSPPSVSWETPSVPCLPQNVVTHLDCATNAAHVEWEGSRGAESYVVHAISLEGDVTQCNTTELSCVVPDLMCGETYNITVVAHNHECNVSESAVTEIQAVPCVPDHVEANVDCESGAVSVTWEHSNGAVSYTAIARGNGGFASFCNTSGTVCEFTDLLCGLTYSITASAADDVCSSAESSAVLINTVPCEIMDINAQMDCSSDTGLVSWEQGEGVRLYRVQAAGPDGHRTQCETNSTSCQLPDLHCGQNYNLTVTAQDGVCYSSKAYLNLQSVPCDPRNVETALQCSSNSMYVSWERASGAVSYEAVGRADDGHTASCNSSVTHCELEGLQCGQTYNISVYAVDDSCNSVDSMSSLLDSAPCPPVNVEAHVDCDSNIMMVMWDPNQDADSFHVEAVTNNSTPLTCDTTDTFCSIINLLCSQNYTVQVMSVRDGCESAPSKAVYVLSVPCVPQEVSGNLDCVTNSAWVLWDHTIGAESYMVTAGSIPGYNSSCSTSDTTCNVPGLRCGVLYTFYVTASNGICTSPPSRTFDIETAPCALTAITAVTHCHSSTIRVGWEITEGSPLYIATAEGSDHSILSCNSTRTSCDLQGVQCGLEYTIIVAASSDKCSSLRSPPHTISTAPCQPQDISLHTDCNSRGVKLSWAPSLVAESYLVTATGRDGDVRTCNTTVSNCSLSELDCGQQYTFTVTASANNCTSPASSPATLSTVPCEPHNVMADMQCATNSAMLSWNASEGSVGYTVYAQGSAGDMHYCHSTNTSCTIVGLECGSMYNFSVHATNGVCNSSHGQLLHQGAVSCPPSMVKVRLLPMKEGKQVTRVSWELLLCSRLEDLVEINGRIQGNNQVLFDVSSYWTDRNYFEIPLPCGSSYNITVKSRSPAGISKPSAVITGITAPCPPIDVIYSGNYTSGVLSWSSSFSATSYTVYVLSSTGRTVECVTAELSCSLVNVNQSAIEITASNSAGESNPTRDITSSGSSRRRRDLQEVEMLADMIESDELSIPDLQVIEVTGTSAYLEWTPVRGASSYILVIKEDSNQRPVRPLVLTVYDETVTVNDLKPGTNYCITLTARNSYTYSLYSQPVCFTTGGER